MKFIAIVFAFALCAGAFGSFTSNRKMSNVLAQVQNLMQTGGPATAVFDLLDGIVDDVRKEQQAHDNLHATHQAQCDEEIGFRNGEVAEATDALDKSTAHQAKCHTSLSRAETALEGNLQSQTETENSIAEKDRVRREEAALFASRTTQRDEAFDAVDEGLRLLDELALGQASLLQVSHATAQMIRKSVQMRQTKAFAPAVTALAQLASSDIFADSSAVERVRELLLEVKDQISNAWTAYFNAEQAAIEHYTTSRAALVSQLEDMRHDEATLRNHIADMNLCLVEEAAVQNEASNKRDRNTQLLNDATNLCNTYYDQYHTATEARNDELRVIAQLKAIVQQRFGQFTSGVAYRADDDEFDAYENQSQYEGAEYTKVGGNYNDAGASQVGYNRDHELERLI